MRKIVKGAPGVYRNDTLFYMYSRQGSFSAIDRAEAASSRMEKPEQSLSFKMDSIKIKASEETTDFTYKGSLLISVSDQQALWNRTTQAELAGQLKSKIGAAIVKYQKETSWQVLSWC
ncbi:MAG: hypothetical protein H7223_09695 [Pedobacter sp.]|nr:hypothetical protein [Pedobacter sp.]